MTPQEFSQLKRGDIVRHIGSGDSYVIERSAGEGNHVAFRSIVVSSHFEWELFRPEPTQPMEFWINVYADSDNVNAHPSRKKADEMANPDRKQCVHVREVQK